MSRKEVYNELNEVFKDIFDMENIELNDKTTSSDIEGWDSLTHISLISAVENKFGIDFSVSDVLNLENVGNLVDLILDLCAKK